MRFPRVLTILLLFSCSAAAQQTVFNVPSADILDRGKVYGEFDATYQHSSGLSTFTPRVVFGLGRNLEGGINFNGLSTPGKQSLTPTPTLKWKVFEDRNKKWAWLVGDDVFIPVQNRSYNIGNYAWTEAARTWRTGTRLTFGIYHATESVFGTKQKVGAQLALEQPLTPRVTIAMDWYSGDCSVCYFTPGVVLKLTKKLSWYGSYQIGNHDLTRGNHGLLMEIGWNFN